MHARNCWLGAFAVPVKTEITAQRLIGQPGASRPRIWRLWFGSAWHSKGAIMFNNALLIDLDEAGVIREVCMPQDEANWRFDCKLAKGEPASVIQLDVDADLDFVRIVSPTLERRISRARAQIGRAHV
jgi:hypothetical protein